MNKKLIYIYIYFSPPPPPLTRNRNLVPFTPSPLLCSSLPLLLRKDSPLVAAYYFHTHKLIKRLLQLFSMQENLQHLPVTSLINQNH